MSRANNYNDGAPVFAIWGERNVAACGANRYFAYGNGLDNAGAGVIVPWASEIIAISCNVTTVVDGDFPVEAYLNGSTTGASVTISAGNSSAYALVGSPISVAAGDRVHLRTSASVAATDANYPCATLWLRRL